VTRVADIARVRSKNAGPFRLTIDVFCENEAACTAVVDRLPNARVARALGVDEPALQRYVLRSIDVVKFSLARPVVQGSAEDRDQHGAQWSMLVESLTLDEV